MKNTSDFISFVQEKFNTTELIPLHEPRFIGNEKSYVSDTIDSTFVSSVGKYVNEFERMIAQISDTKRGVAVVNGTASLQIALKLAGVTPGSEVITQALTFVATVNALSYNNAHPIFIDVDLDTMGLSARAVESFLEEHAELREEGCYNKISGKRIAACMPMHTFGFPVHLDKLLEVCKKWRIPVVEDAAESVGSTYKNKPTGSFGLIGTFSFNGNKIVTAGGGGALVTNDEELGELAKHITTTAKKAHLYEYVHDSIGYNFRMPNLNAALICAQLEMLDLFIEKKRTLATEYHSFLTQLGIKFRSELNDTRANYWLMCVELENRAERDQFLKETNQHGVMTRPIWTLMYKLPMYQQCWRDTQKNAEFLEDRIVNIPSSVITNG